MCFYGARMTFKMLESRHGLYGADKNIDHSSITAIDANLVSEGKLGE